MKINHIFIKIIVYFFESQNIILISFSKADEFIVNFYLYKSNFE